MADNNIGGILGALMNAPMPRPDPRKSGASSLAQLLAGPIPIPQPDPRGNSFVQRIPQGDPLEYAPFRAGEVPTQALMYSRGLPLNPDRLVIPPDWVQQMYFVRDMIGQKT